MLEHLEDMPVITMIREAHPHAAFSHTCAVCRQPIAKGERHSLFVYRDEDAIPPRFMQARCHLFCWPSIIEES